MKSAEAAILQSEEGGGGGSKFEDWGEGVKKLALWHFSTPPFVTEDSS